MKKLMYFMLATLLVGSVAMGMHTGKVKGLEVRSSEVRSSEVKMDSNKSKNLSQPPKAWFSRPQPVELTDAQINAQNNLNFVSRNISKAGQNLGLSSRGMFIPTAETTEPTAFQTKALQLKQSLPQTRDLGIIDFFAGTAGKSLPQAERRNVLENGANFGKQASGPVVFDGARSINNQENPNAMQFSPTEQQDNNVALDAVKISGDEFAQSSAPVVKQQKSNSWTSYLPSLSVFSRTKQPVQLENAASENTVTNAGSSERSVNDMKQAVRNLKANKNTLQNLVTEGDQLSGNAKSNTNLIKTQRKRLQQQDEQLENLLYPTRWSIFQKSIGSGNSTQLTSREL